IAGATHAVAARTADSAKHRGLLIAERFIPDPHLVWFQTLYSHSLCAEHPASRAAGAANPAASSITGAPAVACMRRLAGLAKAFPQQQILVTTWVVVYRSQSLKAVLRVKGWSLEGERCEKDLPTAASASLVLCCPEEFRPQAPATLRLLHPELPNLAATAP